jgi:hypothetical protein
LFIHGHSIAENDKHIFDQINKSEVENIYFSIFDDQYSDSNKTTIANVHRFIDIKKIKIKFYETESAPIWA